MKIETTRHYDRAYESLPLLVQQRLDEAIPALAEAFGKPHAHLGVRKLGRSIYEFRVGLHRRVVFRHESDALFLLFIGTHDEVHRFIRSLR